MSVRTHSLNALAVIVCILVFSAASAFASGSPEAGLKQVQALIAAKDYSAAQKLLVELRRRNPDLVDPTQQYFDIIMAHERSYNAVHRELRDALDRQDLEAAEQLIVRLEEMNPHKGLAAEKRDVKNLRAARGVGAYMDTVAALLRDGKYTRAIAGYLVAVNDPAEAGFGAQRDAFLASRTAAIYITSVQSAVTAMKIASEKAAGMDGEVRAIPAALAILLVGTVNERTASEAARLASPLRSLAGLETEVRRLAGSLSAITTALQASRGGGTEGQYVEYLVDLASGREGRIEGIAAAIRLLWEHSAGQSAEAVLPAASSAFDAALKAYDLAVRSRDPAAFIRADAAFQAAAFKNLAAVEMGKLLQATGTPFTEVNRQSLEALRALGLASQESADESAAFRTLISFQQQAAGYPPAVQASPQARRSAQELTVRVEGLRLEWRSRSQRWSAQSGSSGMDTAALAKAATQMSDRFEAFAQELRATDLSYALQLARVESEPFPQRFSAAAARRLEGEDFLNATKGGKPSADPNELVARLPGKALDSFIAAGSGLEELSKTTSSWKAKWTSDLPLVVQSDGIRALVAEADALEERIATQRGELVELRARAEDNLFNAEKARRDAEAAYTDAEKALGRREYAQARVLAGDDAAGLFLTSLALEEDPRARTRLEKDIPTLLTRIEQAIYAQNVRQVDASIDQAVVFFKATQYLDARLALDKARDLWEQMPEGKTRKYETLEYWYSLVLNALGVSGGRSLASNDPRLDVVSPLMSRARELFAEAERLSAEAERLRTSDPKNQRISDLTTRKTAALAQAGTHVSSVLSVVNGYWEAKVLLLKVRKLGDEAGFRKDAEDGVRSVLAGLAATPRTIKASDAYFELKEYQGLVDDRVLSASIERAIGGLEDELNLRVKQLSREQIAQSTALVAEARNRYKPDNKDTFEGTLALLAQALAVDSNNAAARALRQEVLIRMGSPTVGVLTREDQRIFTEAQNLLNSGGEQNERQSWELIQPLLPKYAAFQPLKKLEATLKARLGL